MVYIIVLLIIVYFVGRYLFKDKGMAGNHQQSKNVSSPGCSAFQDSNVSDIRPKGVTTEEEDQFKGWSYDHLAEFVEKTKEEAARGDLNSIRAMVNIYLNGFKDIVAADKAEAIKYMRMGADKGDMELAFQYAVRQDPSSPDARKYLQLAADSGNAEAQFDMYYILMRSPDDGDHHKASLYLNGACNAGYKDALDELRMLLKKAGRSESEIEKFLLKYDNKTRNFTKTESHVEPENVSTDKELTSQQVADLLVQLKKDAENGKVQSMIWLGDIYDQGQGGLPKDERLALKYWKMAADHGNTDMALKAGLLIGKLDEDYATAFQYIKTSADAGNANAMYVLYDFLANGWGCQKDKNTAYKYLKAAADAGQKDAMIKIKNR